MSRSLSLLSIFTLRTSFLNLLTTETFNLSSFKILVQYPTISLRAVKQKGCDVNIITEVIQAHRLKLTTVVFWVIKLLILRRKKHFSDSQLNHRFCFVKRERSQVNYIMTYILLKYGGHLVRVHYDTFMLSLKYMRAWCLSRNKTSLESHLTPTPLNILVIKSKSVYTTMSSYKVRPDPTNEPRR